MCLLRHLPTLQWVPCRQVFSFIVAPYTDLFVIFWCLFSGFHVASVFTNRGSTIGVLHHCKSLEYCLSRNMCLLVMACDPYQECTGLMLVQLLQLGWSFMLLIQLSLSHSINMVAHTALGTQQTWPILLHSLHSGEESSSPGCVPPNDILNLMWALNLVILMWWLGIRLGNLFTPGW